MDPDGAMENAGGVSHSSLDSANNGAAHRPGGGGRRSTDQRGTIARRLKAAVRRWPSSDRKTLQATYYLHSGIFPTSGQVGALKDSNRPSISRHLPPLF
jgi:hypothetical protein